VEKVTAANAGGLWRVQIDTEAGNDLRPALAAAVLGQGWNLYRLDAASESLDETFLRLTSSADEVSAQ
jgi:hypothetical protein